MRRYTATKSKQAQWLFMVLMYAVMVGVSFVALWITWKFDPKPLHYGIALGSIALFGFMGVGSVYFYLLTLAVYEADDTEIIQRSVFGMRRMRWRDVTQLKEGSGTRDSVVTLTDSGDQKLSIQLTTMGDTGEELRVFIVARLEALRARQTDDFAAQEQTLGTTPRGMRLGDGRSFETITLRGDGKRMQYASTMADYPLLRATLLRNVPPEAIQHGERDRISYGRLQNRIVLIVLSVCCTYLVGMGIWFLYGSIKKIERIERLAKNGVYTMARVTGDDCGCSSGYLNDASLASIGVFGHARSPVLMNWS
jgi:hypothetical protein